MQQLKVAKCGVKIKTFNIVKYKTLQGNEICQVLITHLSNCGKKIYVLLFDIENGTCTKSIHIVWETFLLIFFILLVCFLIIAQMFL